MTTLIVGTGALATLFAHRLARAGEPVALLGSWQVALQALQTQGARQILPNGQVESAPVPVYASPDVCPPVQLALVLVKSWQTARAAEQLAACLAPGGLAISLQNGLGNREILAQRLGAERVLAGVVTYGAFLAAPGLAQPAGEGEVFLEAKPETGRVKALLGRAGFRLRSIPNFAALVWGKLVLNAAINPPSALLGLRNGELMENPSARALVFALAEETAEVARACGVALPYEDASAAVQEVAQKTALNASSMLQDLRRGAPTEIDAISGAVWREAQKVGLEAARNWVMWQVVRAHSAPPVS